MDSSKNFFYMKKLLTNNAKVDYKNPHIEAMRMKYFWNNDEKDNDKIKLNDKKLIAIKYHDNVINIIKNSIDDTSLKKSFKYIKKGLYIDPTFHKLYAVRAKIYEIKKDLKKAIFWYEKARKILYKYEYNSIDYNIILKNYKIILIKLYNERGKFYEDNERYIEAVADYEEILIIDNNLTINLLELNQDNLLNCLRKLNKYEAYRLTWSEFIKSSKPKRRSYLMTDYAEFKINIGKISSARRMLKDAIYLNENNEKAKKLLQVIFDKGYEMFSKSIIWCINGYYDKSLATIDKCFNCDPYNRELTIIKTIVLRLSGRLREAYQWLEWVDKNFENFFLPSNNDDKRKSIIENLTVQDTREILINQWHLIRYDMTLGYY